MDAADAFFDRLYSQFYVHFPCYALLSEDGRGFLAETAADGSTALVLLTDDDLIRRYRDARKTVGVAVPVADAKQLRRVLKALPGHVSHVTFDPSPRFHRRYPVGVLRKRLAELIGK